MNETITGISEYFETHPLQLELLVRIGVLLLAWISYYIAKKYVMNGLRKLFKNTKSTIDDVLLEAGVFQVIAWIVPLIILYIFSGLFGAFSDVLMRILTSLIVVVSMLAIGRLLTALQEIIFRKDPDKQFQVKSSLQITRIIIYIVGSVVFISALLGQSPLVLLSGIGALTAVLLLIFRDTILSFVASLQISTYDLVKVGDWIEVPKFSADGDVIDIALHTIKVQNWDKTITVIPTHKLIDESFKNWRGMSESGGRRIKRAIHIDMTSVEFCTEEMLKRFRKMTLIKDYINKKQLEIEQYNQDHNIDNSERINGRWMTNIGVFRAYLQQYLINHPKIHTKLTFLIRQLPPGTTGLPIEIYVFSNDIDWINYESIQSDIFDHIIASLSRFDLRVYQQPSGYDLNRIQLGAPIGKN